MITSLAFWLIVWAIIAAIGLTLACTLIGTGKGQHKAPRGWAEDSERLATTAERVIDAAIIPRAPTEHAPPWEDQPPPDAYFIAAGTVEGGRLTSARVAVVPPLPPLPDRGGELPDWVVAALNGHASAEDALDSIVSRAMLTDGAS